MVLQSLLEGCAWWGISTSQGSPLYFNSEEVFPYVETKLAFLQPSPIDSCFAFLYQTEQLQFLLHPMASQILEERNQPSWVFSTPCPILLPILTWHRPETFYTFLTMFLWTLSNGVRNQGVGVGEQVDYALTVSSPQLNRTPLPVWLLLSL